MRIKKFHARTFTDALQSVKREFGPDAVILTSEQIGDGGVQVVAATDHEEEPAFTSSEQSTRNQDVQGVLIREITRLREALEQMKKTGFEMNLPRKRRHLLSILLKNAVREEFALRLCEEAGDIDTLINRIEKELRTRTPGSSQKAILLMGPTGVGKTTTLSKLAAHEIRQGRKTGIITLDTHRIGAVEQLRRFTHLLGIPFEVVHRPEDLERAFKRHASRERIFIDTSGRNPSDRSYLEGLKTVMKSGITVETHLVMSASSDDAFLTQAYARYRELPIDCLGFTKLDESVRKGIIYNQAVLYQKPVAYVTTGQRIPGDILFPTSRELAMMILGTEEGLSLSTDEGAWTEASTKPPTQRGEP